MAGETNNKRTILDYLNEDCWRAVLKYVPVLDIIHTERTSRRWRRVVLVYLQSIRFCIEHPSFCGETRRNVYSLPLHSADYRSFKRWTEKLGTSVVATYCDSEESLKLIDKCPNLEKVTLIELAENILLKASQKENLKDLQGVVLKSCPVADHCISQFLANDSLEELEIDCNDQVTGQCLININSKTFKSLILKKCNALQSHHLLTAADRLSGLSKLLLFDAPRETYNEVTLVLDKMPRLECLYNIVEYDFEKKDGIFFMSVSRLSRLKYLYLNIDAAGDRDLDVVTQNCRELQVLWLERCYDVSRRGVAAVCRNAGPRLVALALWYSDHLTNDDALFIVRSCPNLKSLDLYGCLRLSAGLLPRAAAARRRLRARALLRASPALRLRTADVYREDDDNQDYAAELKARYPELDLYYHDFRDRKDYDTFWYPESSVRGLDFVRRFRKTKETAGGYDL